MQEAWEQASLRAKRKKAATRIIKQLFSFYRLICRPTTTCLTDRNVTVTRANFECCEGFTTRPAPDDAYNKYYFNFYYNQVPQEPEGCRIGM